MNQGNGDRQEKEKLLLILRLEVDKAVYLLDVHALDALKLFARERSKEPFKGLFEVKLHQISIDHLRAFSAETIQAFYDFLKAWDDLRWLLRKSESMPTTMESEFHAMMKEVREKYQLFNLYAQAEGQGEKAALA